MRVMIHGVEHVAIASPDPDALASWYVSKLGYAIESHSPASRNYFLKAKNGSEAGDHFGRNPAPNRGNARRRNQTPGDHY